MSIRAYKIKKIETSKKETFNISEHYEMLEDMSSWVSFNYDGEIYHIEFNKDDLEQKITELNETNVNDKISDYIKKEQIKIIEKILKDMKKEEKIMYTCY